jgi:hypothetical protein
VREQGVRGQALLLPALHPGHSQGMATRRQTRRPSSGRRRAGDALAPPRTPIVPSPRLQRLSLGGDEKGCGGAVVGHTDALGLVVTQTLGRAGREGNQPGFMALRLPEVSVRRIAIEVDRVPLSAEGFTDPQTGAGQQPEHTA